MSVFVVLILHQVMLLAPPPPPHTHVLSECPLVHPDMLELHIQYPRCKERQCLSFFLSFFFHSCGLFLTLVVCRLPPLPPPPPRLLDPVSFRPSSICPNTDTAPAQLPPVIHRNLAAKTNTGPSVCEWNVTGTWKSRASSSHFPL